MNESDLIAWLIPRAGKHRDIILGIGDDCAILRPRAGEDLLFKIDPLIEGIHFTSDLAATAIGARAISRSLSDIAAMGGEPRFCLVSLSVGKGREERWVKSFFQGLLKVAANFGVVLAGGDLSHDEKTHIDVTLCGAVPRGQALRRDGARVGDQIYVSGPLGKSWTRPIQPRIELGRKLRRFATSCIDISDGLSLDLQRVCLASGVAAEVDNLPVVKGSSIERAWHGGEDYELLFTLPAAKKRGPAGTTKIGRIVRGTPGSIRYQGKPVEPRGYDHFINR